MTTKSRTLLARAALMTGVAAFGLLMNTLRGDVDPATKPTTAPTTQPVAATAPKFTSTQIDIERLITQLGSDSPDDRDSAQRQLVDTGTAAIPALKKAAEENEDPEVRSRAAAAMAQMKDRDSTDATQITLHMKNASTSDVLAEISRQAHAQINSNGTGRIAGVDDRAITVDADRKPFWDVMSDVCGQLNAIPALDGSSHGSLLLTAADQRNWTQSAHQLCGPFWLSVAGVYRNRTIDLQGPESVDDQFSVRIIICPEPKLAVAQISELLLKQASDNAGHSLLPKPPANAAARAAQIKIDLAVNQMNRMNRMVESRLSYPENPGSKIAVLRGEVNVTIGQDNQQYIVDDVLGTPKISNPLKNCAVNVTVIRQSNAADTYRALIQCTREGLSDEQWSAMISRMNSVTLEDADGKQLSPWPFATPITITGPTMSMTCIFSRINIFNPVLRLGGVAVPAPAKQGEPKKLTWNVATSLKSIRVPIEFKDLPMP